MLGCQYKLVTTVAWKLILTWRGSSTWCSKRAIIKVRLPFFHTALHAVVCGGVLLCFRVYARRIIFARVGLRACRRPRTKTNKKNTEVTFTNTSPNERRRALNCLHAAPNWKPTPTISRGDCLSLSRAPLLADALELRACFLLGASLLKKVALSYPFQQEDIVYRVIQKTGDRRHHHHRSSPHHIIIIRWSRETLFIFVKTSQFV